MAIRSVNPATGERLRDFGEIEEREIERRVQSAERAFRSYRKTPFSERARWLLRAAEILENQKEAWGRLMTQEMGKPIRAAIQEAEKCARACRYYAEHGESHLREREVPTGDGQAWVRFQPLGAILAIMPWNFPFWQVFRFAVPALMAGNTVLLKHASNVPQCALAIEEIFREAGFPDGAFQALLIPAGRALRLLEDPRIAAASLTGSDSAGSEVGCVAGKQIKKLVLELGGSDPFIVMPSADLDAAARMAVAARVINNGESCIAAKRFIVADELYAEFERRFVEGMAALRVGDPMDPSVDVGPLAMPESLDRLERQVRDSVRAGAHVLTGGRRPDRPGFYYEPTVLADIPRESPAYREEVFGPVGLLFRARDLDEALRLANSTRYGLGASFWSREPGEQERFIEEIESGLAFVNGMVASDPRLPFGGIKRSGYGRELGEFGIREFVNIKTVRVQGSLTRSRPAGTE